MPRPHSCIALAAAHRILQKQCPRVVTLFHRVPTCLRLALRMETAVGAPRLARVEDGGWPQLAQLGTRARQRHLVSASLVQFR
jgi:hypothetical protein